MWKLEQDDRFVQLFGLLFPEGRILGERVTFRQRGGERPLSGDGEIDDLRASDECSRPPPITRFRVRMGLEQNDVGGQCRRCLAIARQFIQRRRRLARAPFGDQRQRPGRYEIRPNIRKGHELTA